MCVKCSTKKRMRSVSIESSACWNLVKSLRSTCFFKGQMYDAFKLLAELIERAERTITLVDGYVGLGTLNILAKKQSGVIATIWTTNRGDSLSHTDIATFNEQYPILEVRHTEEFHDRYLVLDGSEGYHIGASLKDAGKKAFGINRLEDPSIVEAILERL